MQQLPKPEQAARDEGIRRTDWRTMAKTLTGCCAGCPSAATQDHCAACELYYLKLTVGQCLMRQIWLNKNNR